METPGAGGKAKLLDCASPLALFRSNNPRASNAPSFFSACCLKIQGSIVKFDFIFLLQRGGKNDLGFSDNAGAALLCETISRRWQSCKFLGESLLPQSLEQHQRHAVRQVERTCLIIK